MTHYADRDHAELDRDGNYYCRHVAAMTKEGLHAKSDIAAELAWRDREIDRLRRTPQPVTPAGGEVAWVEVVNTHEGPYNFHGKELLPVGDHSLYLHPPAADAALLCFVAAVMDEWYEGDLDGGTRQDLAEKHGLLIATEVTESCGANGEHCTCAEYGDFPQTCYRPSPLLIQCQAALNQRGGGDHG